MNKTAKFTYSNNSYKPDDFMETKELDGEIFLRMLSGGSKNIRANSKSIDDLNVFPVPDGDTGSNMTRTFETGFIEAGKTETAEKKNLSAVAGKMAHGMLLGARGNSGVILSQIFKGIQLELTKYSSVNALQLVAAYESGVKQSYHAVVNPVEGTILTVFREATEYAKTKITEASSIEDFYKAHIEGAKISLPKTKEILDVLKEADVIDSGGAGYLCIAEGMLGALLDENYAPKGEMSEALLAMAESNAAGASVDISAFTRDSVLEFGYCTECLLRLQTAKVQDVDNFDINLILNFLNEIGGESIVAYKEEDIIKLHVHTPNPGTVLNELRKYGEFLTVKIENMALQHEEKIKAEGSAPKKSEKRKELAVVAVANGEGLKTLFGDLGCDYVIDGGQTGNPPASAFLEAFDALNADNIIVLPNNSNIILTAKQAADMFEDSAIHVIPTKSIQQCYSALAIINPAVEDIESMVEDVKDYITEVISGDVALAIRDAELCGKSIKNGDYMGMFGDDIVSVTKDKLSALEEMMVSLDAKTLKEKELLTLFCGADVSEEEAEKAENLLVEKYPDLEVTRYDGGQPVYSFLVGIE